MTTWKSPRTGMVIAPGKNSSGPRSNSMVIRNGNGNANIPVPPNTPQIAQEGSLMLGWYFNADKNEWELVRISQQDRETHLYIVGKTRFGKTKLIEFLIQQDIQNRNGFCFIDPHGDSIEAVKGMLAVSSTTGGGEEQLDRVVIIEPTHPTHSVIFNLLEALPGVSATKQAQELVNATKKIWHDSWGPRMEMLYRSSLVALGEAGQTFGDLPQFLASKEFRAQVLDKVRDPIARMYFERFDSLSNRDQLTWSEPVTNKVYAFLSDARIRRMLSYPKSTFDLRDIMDNKKILLVKLDKGQLNDGADLLGSLMMSKIVMAAFSRSDIPKSQRVPFYLYVDEFQNFASDSFADVLSEAAKYGLSLIMAHQTLAQIPQDLASIILGNTGIQVFFQINRQDAELLAKEAFEYSGYEVKTASLSGPRHWSLGEEWEQYIAELQTLPKRWCYIKHKIEGGVVPLNTATLENPWDALGMEEEEFPKYLSNLQLGSKYSHPIDMLADEPIQQHDSVPTPSGDGLGEQEKAFLGHVAKHPDHAISQVYKGVALSVRKGNTLRDTLKDQGLIQEIETRMGKLGRRAKFFVLTFEAFELLQIKPPKGRGGAVHRYVQQMIKSGALSKGYQAQCEKQIEGGAIVDVHLEKEGKQIAVEVAVASTPDREIAHISSCLGAGYQRVFTVFSDEKLLEKTQSAMKQTLSQEEIAKVTLLPLSKLTGAF